MLNTAKMKLLALLLKINLLQQTLSQLIPLDSPSGPQEWIFKRANYTATQPIYLFLYDHGCFCSKIFDITSDYMDKSLRDGNVPVDALDEICMNWMRARECDCNFPGGDCHLVDKRNRYYESSDCQSLADVCEKSLCLIDEKYFTELETFVLSNLDENDLLTLPKVSITEASLQTCPKGVSSGQTKFCAGTAPNVYIHKCINFCENGPFYTGFSHNYLENGIIRQQPDMPNNDIIFRVKNKNDAHILLTTEAGREFEIVIGGWSNTRSVIRNRRQGNWLAWYNNYGPCDPNEYKRFYISWNNNQIDVKEGGKDGPSLMTLDGYEVYLDEGKPISKVYIATGWGSDGNWIFEW